MEELETVQSILMDDLPHREEGRSHVVSFSMEGQPVLTLVLKPGKSYGKSRFQLPSLGTRPS